MGQEVIRVSDLSGQRIEDPEQQLVDIVVTDHPDLGPDQQARLEALPDEVRNLSEYAIAAVRLSVTMPGNETPTGYILPQDKFDQLATIKPMEEVLAAAALVKVMAARRSHNRTTSGEPLRSFDTLEHAGEPHKGKVSAAEAELVRNNLEAINERLSAQGKATIDPANPDHAKRYGFDTQATSAAVAETTAKPQATAGADRAEPGIGETAPNTGTRRGRVKT